MTKYNILISELLIVEFWSNIVVFFLTILNNSFDSYLLFGACEDTLSFCDLIYIDLTYILELWSLDYDP